MSRACVYLVNDNPLYLKMLRKSVSMLRKHNATMPITILHVGSAKFEVPADIKVVRKEPVNIPGEDGYFPINKIHLASCEEDEILFLDCDTLIFGDVGKIFEAYLEYEAVGCWNRWVYSRGFNSESLGIKPLNSGVMLWKSELLKEASSKLIEYCAELREGKTNLGKWLWSLGGNCWQREEFAYSLFIERHGLKHAYFDRRCCQNLEVEADFLKMNESIVFHTYTGQWERACRMIKSKKEVVVFRPVLGFTN